MLLGWRGARLDAIASRLEANYAQKGGMLSYALQGVPEAKPMNIHGTYLLKEMIEPPVSVGQPCLNRSASGSAVGNTGSPSFVSGTSKTSITCGNCEATNGARTLLGALLALLLGARSY